jgi:hypothetical protein
MERHPRMGHEYAIAPPGIRAFAPGYSWMATHLGRELRELREAGSGGAQRTYVVRRQGWITKGADEGRLDHERTRKTRSARTSRFSRLSRSKMFTAAVHECRSVASAKAAIWSNSGTACRRAALVVKQVYGMIQVKGSFFGGGMPAWLYNN